eukprot:355558_1
MTDSAVPDIGNFEVGDKPIPDNFLDDTLQKAVTEHRRKESQIASVEKDFSKHLDKNVAQNLAQNLIGYIGSNNNENVDPDENDTRQEEEDEDDDIYDEEDKPTIDQVLIEAVHSHKHRKSRTDFVEKKLHELFPQTDDRNDLVDSYTTKQEPVTALNQTDDGMGGGYGSGAMDMSLIASNLVSFLHDEPPPSKPQTP